MCTYLVMIVMYLNQVGELIQLHSLTATKKQVCLSLWLYLQVKETEMYCIANGGEASSWDYGQKLKKHLKHFFAKFQLSTIYGF